MAIEIQTIQQLQESIVNSLILSINSGEPDTSKHVTDIRNSFIRSFAESMAAGFDENNDVLKQLIIQLFPQTATGEYLERWASFFGITRDSGIKATGNIVFTGTATTQVPSGTLIQKADGTEYSTQSLATITAQTINISGITRSGTIATATTTSDHNLASGVSVIIAGANEAEYNVTATITVTAANQFTYSVSGSPSTPATGTITLDTTFANVAVEAVNLGVAGNASNGSQFNLVTPISNVDDTCFTDFNGLRNGTNVESDQSLRERLLERTSNFTAPFTASGLPVFIKQNVAGVTRIWIEQATPSAGYVTIYFTRDNDTNIIPTAVQRDAVKNAIINTTTGIKPANTPDSYVIVSSPTAVPIDFTFSALSPNTEAMQSAITETLTDYFKSDSIVLEQDVTLNEVNALIFSVLDSEGNSPTFTLTSPSGTTTISSGELATLGTITYP